MTIIISWVASGSCVARFSRKMMRIWWAFMGPRLSAFLVIILTSYLHSKREMKKVWGSHEKLAILFVLCCKSDIPCFGVGESCSHSKRGSVLNSGLSLLGSSSCHALSIPLIFSCIMLHVSCMYWYACFTLHERARTHLRNLWWNLSTANLWPSNQEHSSPWLEFGLVYPFFLNQH